MSNWKIRSKEKTTNRRYMPSMVNGDRILHLIAGLEQAEQDLASALDLLESELEWLKGLKQAMYGINIPWMGYTTTRITTIESHLKQYRP